LAFEEYCRKIFEQRNVKENVYINSRVNRFHLSFAIEIGQVVARIFFSSACFGDIKKINGQGYVALMPTTRLVNVIFSSKK
jgi:hypothetical protein